MLKLESIVKKPINGIETECKIYKNTITGTECTMYLLRTDIFGNKWWSFEDLFTLPFIRQLSAKKVLDLYGHGLAMEDIKLITGQLKSVLKSNDVEKYEKAYAKVLELDNLTETLADPVRQCMGLCTVYLLFNDEFPDAWSNEIVSKKMTAMAQDIESQAFFLNWWIGVMKQSGQVLKGLSQIASTVNELDTSTAVSN
jgi:hypothetical protein